MKQHLINSPLTFKTIILLIIFLVPDISLSQITINSEHFKKMFSSPGFHYYTEGTAGNFNIGKTGGPNVYDFSNISLQNLLVSNNYEVSSIPSLVIRYPGTAVTFGDSPTTIEKNPVFLIGNDTAFTVGEASFIPSKRFVHYRPYEIIAVFPATYGQTINQQIEKFDTTFNSGGQVVSSDYSTSNEVTTIDGYGVLKLSGHQYNCIRIKKDHNGYGDKEYIFLTTEGATMLVGGVPISSPDTGTVSGFGQIILASAAADVQDQNELATTFGLKQNFPNPFNPVTKINYVLTKQEFVSLTVYGILGNEVSCLVNEEQQAGNYEISFDAKNLASGTYFYKLQTDGLIQVRKMIVLK